MPPDKLKLVGITEELIAFLSADAQRSLGESS
jgi:hypothetical protein